MWEEAGRMRLKDIEFSSPRSFFVLDKLSIADVTTIENSVIRDSSVAEPDRG